MFVTAALAATSSQRFRCPPGDAHSRTAEGARKHQCARSAFLHRHSEIFEEFRRSVFELGWYSQGEQASGAGSCYIKYTYGFAGEVFGAEPFFHGCRGLAITFRAFSFLAFRKEYENGFCLVAFYLVDSADSGQPGGLGV